jgi:glycosyltransferase involved in cell wall biosynthesis
MKRLCFVATVPAAIHSFLRDNIIACSEKWVICVVSSPDEVNLLRDLNAEYVPIIIERKPSFWRDLFALVRLILLFKLERFNLVQSITPKAGLLTMLAGFLSGVPIRIHTFTGQVWVSKLGFERFLLKIFDRLIVLFSTNIFVDSPSQRDFLVAEGVLPKNKGIVIGGGSICGVDTNRFLPDAQARDVIRSELDIGAHQTVILFLGRLNRDKGILDLASAFSSIASQDKNVVLLLIGAEENVSFSEIQEICGVGRDRLRRVGFTPEPQRYMAAADIFCLPSYREGFGQAIIEAASCGVPAVASRIYGIIDAVEDGKTGLLSAPRDVSALVRNLQLLIGDKELCREMGCAARSRAKMHFSREKIVYELVSFYGELLDKSLGKVQSY